MLHSHSTGYINNMNLRCFVLLLLALAVTTYPNFGQARNCAGLKGKRGEDCAKQKLREVLTGFFMKLPKRRPGLYNANDIFEPNKNLSSSYKSIFCKDKPNYEITVNNKTKDRSNIKITKTNPIKVNYTSTAIKSALENNSDENLKKKPLAKGSRKIGNENGPFRDVISNIYRPSDEMANKFRQHNSEPKDEHEIFTSVTESSLDEFSKMEILKSKRNNLTLAQFHDDFFKMITKPQKIIKKYNKTVKNPEISGFFIKPLQHPKKLPEFKPIWVINASEMQSVMPHPAHPSYVISPQASSIIVINPDDRILFQRDNNDINVNEYLPETSSPSKRNYDYTNDAGEQLRVPQPRNYNYYSNSKRKKNNNGNNDEFFRLINDPKFLEFVMRKAIPDYTSRGKENNTSSSTDLYQTIQLLAYFSYGNTIRPEGFAIRNLRSLKPIIPSFCYKHLEKQRYPTRTEYCSMLYNCLTVPRNDCHKNKNKIYTWDDISLLSGVDFTPTDYFTNYCRKHRDDNFAIDILTDCLFDPECIRNLNRSLSSIKDSLFKIIPLNDPEFIDFIRSTLNCSEIKNNNNSRKIDKEEIKPTTVKPDVKDQSTQTAIPLQDDDKNKTTDNPTPETDKLGLKGRIDNFKRNNEIFDYDIQDNDQQRVTKQKFNNDIFLKNMVPLQQNLNSDYEHFYSMIPVKGDIESYNKDYFNK
ncbi:uncharacterized protein LOC142333549 isoform X2 [Lycorma delicatula]